VNKPFHEPSNVQKQPERVTDSAGEETGEQTLIGRSREGDLAAFDELITRHRNRIFAMLYQMTRNEEDAWDLSQETFVKAWKSIGRFGGRSSFFTWLYRIAANLAIDALRKRAAHPTVSFDEPEAGREAGASLDVGQPATELNRSEIRSRIDAALETLSPEHRAAIVLKEIDGLQYHEIAGVVGCSIGTVMSRLFYARKKLQLQLRDLYENA
jgi:RNA polymerase sigma-70 factor (ECF subfamily)